jgi:quercetin 2,3-dioxygenase
MIQLRRACDRHCLRGAGQNLWLTFYPGLRKDPLANGFGDLMALNEGFVTPVGSMLTYSRRGSKTITYVVQGLMSQKSQSRPSTLIRAGDFQLSSADFSQCAINSNASPREELHVLQISLQSEYERQPNPQQRNFSCDDRGGRVRLVGSADGREGSLALGQDVLLYSVTLTADLPFAYPLLQGRIAWLQVLHGHVSANGALLGAGDGAGVSSVTTLSLQATSDAEIVLLDLPDHLASDGIRPKDIYDAVAKRPSDSVAAAARNDSSYGHRCSDLGCGDWGRCLSSGGALARSADRGVAASAVGCM